ncbi:MAG TPA: lysophospholipid acyltransferase family protein [Phycisphaerae bacterium]|nr:lysophospholipid acyltransferase family protein [Phycisphaerae bacterium]
MDPAPTDPANTPSAAPSPTKSGSLSQARPYTYRGEGTSKFQALSWNVGRLLSRIAAMLLFRLHVSGQARIPKTGGVLMVTNHQSFLDPWLIGIAPSRQIHYMARDTLFKGGFLHYLLELWNVFPVKRGHADLTAIRTAVECLQQGYIVNVFPEGTRSEDGSIGQLAPGISLILNRCKSEVSILPVVIDGAFEAWPRDRKIPRFFGGRIRICHGKPIAPATWRQWSPDEIATRIRREMIKLQHELHSAHAERSAQRLTEDEGRAATESKPRRRRVPN